ncbi:Non-reducing polyketide synthase andM [Vanrija pseudolonga]|uniref:Non-reducing polyketide synthase andM n=1 Tax=Vanrija pseudolonga TaxID=143232 RepID=A0AAF0YF07_9TREE|nr:Non-reducing polyketide synthase andM [Vanrija pseudolonga]
MSAPRLPPPEDYVTPFTDHVYAVKHGVELRLRVWPSASPDPAPWVLWSHGGAWLFGLHEDPTAWVVPGFHARGYHVVSFTYRYAPIANIEDILTDGRDAHAWCVAHLPNLLRVDIERYVLAGDSAGGHLATTLAQLVSPPPRAVLSDHGLVDLADAHYDTLRFSGSYTGEFGPEEIEAAIQDRDYTRAFASVPEETRAKWPLGEVRRAFHAPRVQYGRREQLQADVKTALAERGAWVAAVLHPERFSSSEQLKAYARKWSPLHMLDAAPSYPPTFFIHGEADNIVPTAQSRAFAAKLRARGVAVGGHYEPGEGHCYDEKFTSPNVEGYTRCVVACLDFIGAHVART